MNDTERLVYRTKQSKPNRKRSWSDYPDRMIRNFSSLPHAESLSPSVSTLMDAIAGDERCRAIIAAWHPARMRVGC